MCTFGRALIWLADMSLLYACVRMVLDSQGPIIKFMSMSLKQKQTPQNYFGSGQMYVLSILIIYPQLKGVLNIPILSISLLECRPACMATFAKRWVIHTGGEKQTRAQHNRNCYIRDLPHRPCRHTGFITTQG